MEINSPDKEEFIKFIGSRIREIRTQKGLSLSELGLLGNFDKHALSKIENGKKEITIYSLKGICDSLGISFKDFFTNGI
jgi:transcriptional regulator with XRE-family HTH domain